MVVTVFFFAEFPLPFAILGVGNCSISRGEKGWGETIVIPKVGLSRNLIFQPVSMLISFKKFGITFPPF